MTLQHRVLSTYVHRRSKCPRCATACRDSAPAGTRLLAHAQLATSVEVNEIRADRRRLPGHGIGGAQIAALSGIGVPTIGPILGRRAAPSRLTTWVAAILAVLPILDNVASARVAATGTRRHLEALMFAGWPVSQLHTCPELVWMDRFLAAGRLAAATARSVRGNSNTMGTIPSRGFARQRTRQDLDLRVPTGDLL